MIISRNWNLITDVPGFSGDHSYLLFIIKKRVSSSDTVMLLVFKIFTFFQKVKY